METRHQDSPTRIKKIVYRPEDTPDLVYDEWLGDPGEFPYTRGIYREMYQGRLWTMRQYAGYASATESNRRYRYLMEQGTTGLSVAFDLPTQIGLDSDHPLARGEVGRVGVAIDSLDDMRRLFDKIPLDKVSTSMTINSTAAILLGLYAVAAEEQGVDWRRLRGTIQNDILKEYIARGTYVYPPQPSMRLVTDIIEFCHRELPAWNTISVSGYHIREAGSTAAQEVAFTLANAETYVQAALKRSLEVDDFAPRISFFFNAHNNLLEEVAKFRAARRIWARLMRDRYQARDPKSWMLRFHAQTAGSTLTAQQPDNNVVRVAYQALAAVLGGTQSLHTNARDEALSLPTSESAGLALRTQQILAHETAVDEVADPLGGSWYIESTTNRIQEEAESYLERVRSLGGMLRAIETGYVQREIERSAYQCQKDMESERIVVVGVNRYRDEERAAPLEILRIDSEIEVRQVRRLQELRQRREPDAVRQSLERVREVAAGQENLLPSIIRAVKAHATVGEISDALRDVFGEYKETQHF